MPYLFCEEHGRQHEALCDAEQESYRLLGEAVLIVTGPIKGASFHCDRCNVRLRNGQPAWLMTPFPRHVAESLAAYDYRYERNYFPLDRVTFSWYGAEPPGGMPAPASLLEAG